MTLYMTYDNQEQTDGLGAQVLRIIGVYSIAQKYRIKYIHSPIEETIEEFAHGVMNDQDLTSLINQTNEFFKLPSSLDDFSFDLEIRVRNLSLRFLVRKFLRHQFSRKSVLLRVCLPFGITDRNPEIYKNTVEHLRGKRRKFLSERKKNQIVLHFRMGYGQRTPVSKHVAPRFLPLDYFLSVIQKISEKNLKSEVRDLLIHTDLSNKEVLWSPSKKTLRTVISFGGEIVDGKVLVPKNDVLKMFEVPEDFDIQVKYCANFFETFDDMVNAEVLVMSRSAFSYLAALFNKNLVIYPSSHGHAKLAHWISSDSLGVPSDYRLIPG